MPPSVCLNVYRHAELPVPRGHETYDQFIDLAWRQRNDDINPDRAPAQVAEAVSRLLLDPVRPLRIFHSPTLRTRKTAELLREALAGRFPEATLATEPALAEPTWDYPALMSRGQFESSSRAPGVMLALIMGRILAGHEGELSGGATPMARRVAALRRLLASEGAVNHLWVSHGPVMPFLYQAFVDGLPPAAWTLERALARGPYGYVGGFGGRIAADSSA